MSIENLFLIIFFLEVVYVGEGCGLSIFINVVISYWMLYYDDRVLAHSSGSRPAHTVVCGNSTEECRNMELIYRVVGLSLYFLKGCDIDEKSVILL